DVLLAGAPFAAPKVTFTPPADWTTLRTAAAFYVRYAGVPTFPEIAWYSQAVADLNHSQLSTLPPSLLPLDLELPPAMALAVPRAYQDSAQTDTYTTLPGDTLTRIGATLCYAQLHGSDTGPTGWPDFRGKVTSAGGAMTLPAWTDLEIAQGETPAM